MEIQQKLKIRNTARTLHRVTLTVLGLALVVGLALRAVEPKFIRLYFAKPLIQASGAVVGAFGEFTRERRDGLTNFIPPGDPDEMLLWGKTVESYLAQPAAVFVREGSHMTWINAPKEFAAALEKVPPLFRNEAGAALGSLDTLGSFERRRAHVEADSIGYTVWVVGPLGDSLRWGAVVPFEDTWRPFFKMLEEGASGAQVHRVSQQLNNMMQIENAAPQPTSRTGMRAFLRDEEVYATPGLDTTHHIFPVKLSSYARIEYYLSDEDQKAMDYFLAKGLSWGKLLLTLAVAVVVHLFWGWTKALTAE